MLLCTQSKAITVELTPDPAICLACTVSWNGTEDVTVHTINNPSDAIYPMLPVPQVRMGAYFCYLLKSRELSDLSSSLVLKLHGGHFISLLLE